MSDTVLQMFYCRYFARYPIPPISNDMLQGYNWTLVDAEKIADACWTKEKIIIEKTKEELREWLYTNFPEGISLESALEQVPQLDVIPALDEYTNLFMKDLRAAEVGDLPCEFLDYKPLKSDTYSIRYTFKYADACSDEPKEEGDKGVECDRVVKEKRVHQQAVNSTAQKNPSQRRSLRVQFNSDHREVESISEHNAHRERELITQLLL
ncbi:hypothetical protein GYMLUDRAFT_64028 [Collybiopsis luxurians FD-317 M1]|uniref:Uncharacterized protein n=1 Tax=Collybiopsis luxurians FD-317 M1 TaxID=944289 RepID=A0A0D0ARC7_9AGAR|nr:hypothetical protein GYMLUDRAFT_64028 [Collybiopsis luxurians FD-317 M1]